MSNRVSSSIGRRSPRRANPSMSSGVYVLPPPMTAIFTPMLPRSDGDLTRLLITLSAIAAESTPTSVTPPRRSGPLGGSLPTRARSDPAAPPGLPGPEGCPRRGRVACGRPHAHRTRHGRALWLQPHHDPASVERARPRRPARAHAWPRHVRARATDRRRLLRLVELQRGVAAPGPRAPDEARCLSPGGGGGGCRAGARTRGRRADALHRTPQDRCR